MSQCVPHNIIKDHSLCNPDANVSGLEGGCPDLHTSIRVVKSKATHRAPLFYRYETMVSKEAVGQVHFRVTKYNRADYIALNLPYSTGVVSFVTVWVTERNHILSLSLLII